MFEGMFLSRVASEQPESFLNNSGDLAERPGAIANRRHAEV
jgi:hypothetical protein